jgi:hypothetical protein
LAQSEEGVLRNRWNFSWILNAVKNGQNKEFQRKDI